MELHTLREEDAVSPVIGVILMVAITVILAAVIASFVLGLGSTVDSGPQASFSYEFADGGDGFGPSDGNDEITITHDSGDTIEATSVAVLVSGTEVTGPSWPDTEIGAGDSFTVQDADVSMESGDDVRVVWNNPDSDKTATLSSATVP